MTIGVYDPYLDSLGGGERYMLTAASLLAKNNTVHLFWNTPEILEKASKHLNIDTKNIQVVPDVLKNKTLHQKYFSTRKYDRLFILSDGSIPVTFAKKTILHFQFPVEWVNSKSINTKIKMKKISDVVCNSNFTKKYIDKKFGINASVIYPPCGNMDIKPDVENKKNQIVTVGRYNKLRKGESFKKHEFLIEVFKAMVDQGLKNWEFIIALSYLEDVKEEVSNLFASTNKYPIKIIAQSGNDDIKKLYKNAQIYWHAAGYGENLEKYPERAEHFGITTVEAMSTGVVPIVINAGGQREIIDTNKNGFLWNTKDELIAYTKQMMIKNDLRKRFALAAYDKSKKFSTENFEINLNKIMQ